MSMTQKEMRIHRFHGIVGLSFSDTQQLYLTSADAKLLAKELNRFAKNAEKVEEKWVATRIVKDGTAITESTGEKKVHFLS